MFPIRSMASCIDSYRNAITLDFSDNCVQFDRDLFMMWLPSIEEIKWAADSNCPCLRWSITNNLENNVLCPSTVTGTTKFIWLALIK